MPRTVINSSSRGRAEFPFQHSTKLKKENNSACNKESYPPFSFLEEKEVENAFFNESSSYNKFALFPEVQEQAIKSHTESAKDVSDEINKCFNLINPRAAILKAMCMFIEDNVQKIEACIEKLKNFENQNENLNEYAANFSKTMQEEYDDKLKSFKLLSDKEILSYSGDEAPGGKLYITQRDNLKNYIYILQDFIADINEKINRDAIPVRPLTGFYFNMIEAFSGFSLTMINVVAVLNPAFSIYCISFSIVAGVLLFFARMHYCAKISNFDLINKKENLSKTDVFQDIRKCIPKIRQYINISEEIIIECQKEFISLLKNIQTNQIKSDVRQKNIQVQLKNIDSNLNVHQKSVQEEFKSVHASLNENTQTTLGLLDKSSKSMESLTIAVKSMSSGDSWNDSPYSSRPTTPLPEYERRGSGSSAFNPPSPIFNKNNYFPNNYLPERRGSTSSINSQFERRGSTTPTLHPFSPIPVKHNEMKRKNSSLSSIAQEGLCISMA